MAYYTMSEVRIDGSYPIPKILELTMDVGVNRHGLLTYGGLVSEIEAKQFIEQRADRQAVKVFLQNGLEFSGYPQEIKADHQNDHYYLRVTLVTSSQLMDNDPHDRFFQNTNCTFSNILTEAYDDSQIGSLVAVQGKERIGKPILQYHETDWQFTLRMAGRLCTTVFPDVASTEPQVTLGIPKRQAIDETKNIGYSVSCNADQFRHKYAEHNSTQNIGFQNFLCYKMKSENRYRLGDSVRVDGKILTVMQKSLKYEKGEVQEHYILGHEQEFAVSFHRNRRIEGLELEGIVLNRSGQEIQTLLDIDAGRKSLGKTWFSYSPATNNGMYSMPLENEKVMLQWQSDVDDNVLVARPDRKNNNDTQPPAERHFQTDCKNSLMMIRNKVEYTNPVGSMKWLAAKGFDISTGKNLSIFAQQNVIICSQAQIDVSSPERISICKTGVESSIDMLSNELHIKAVKKVKSTSKANKYKRTPLPERMQSFTINAATASKLVAAVPQISNAKRD